MQKLFWSVDVDQASDHVIRVALWVVCRLRYGAAIGVYFQERRKYFPVGSRRDILSLSVLKINSDIRASVLG